FTSSRSASKNARSAFTFSGLIPHVFSCASGKTRMNFLSDASSSSFVYFGMTSLLSISMPWNATTSAAGFFRSTDSRKTSRKVACFSPTVIVSSGKSPCLSTGLSSLGGAGAGGAGAAVGVQPSPTARGRNAGRGFMGRLRGYVKAYPAPGPRVSELTRSVRRDPLAASRVGVNLPGSYLVRTTKDEPVSVFRHRARHERSDPTESVMADSPIDELKKLLDQALAELAACADEAALRAWNTKYFGDKGQVKAALGKIGTVPKEQKPAYGQEVNRIKDVLTTAYEKALAEAKETALAASLTANPL